MEDGKSGGGSREDPAVSCIQTYIDQTTHDPGENDVLFGRGGETNNHCGNVKFRQLIWENKRRYRDASKAEKPKVAKAIVQQWRSQNPPGRFLGKISAEDGSIASLWADMGDQAAQRKASKSLGEQGKKRSSDATTEAGAAGGCAKKMSVSSQESDSTKVQSFASVSAVSAAAFGNDLRNQQLHSLDLDTTYSHHLDVRTNDDVMQTSNSSMNPNTLVWRLRNFSHQTKEETIPKAAKVSCTSGTSSTSGFNSTTNTDSSDAAAADSVGGILMHGALSEQGETLSEQQQQDPFAVFSNEIDRNQSMGPSPSSSTMKSNGPAAAAAAAAANNSEEMEAFYENPGNALTSLATFIPTAADLTRSAFSGSSTSGSSELGDEYM